MVTRQAGDGKVPKKLRRPAAADRQPLQNGSVTARSAISVRLARDYARLGTWRAVAALHGISSGMAFRVGEQGYEPKDAAIRARLGLATLKPAPACMQCGEVHPASVCYQRPPAPELRPVTAWARRVRSGAVVLARSRRCARRRCGVHFVPITPSQRYCSQACAERQRRTRSNRPKL